jgi:hypothetical protein
MARIIGLTVIVPAVLLSIVVQAHPQTADTPYPHMAALDQYLVGDPNAEIALARSAAPKAISDNAEVMVLDRKGYTTAAKGTNGFVCMVLRSWTAGIDDPDFWNPKIRSPICFNAPAARSYLPIVIAKTRLVVAGKSKAQISDAIGTALENKELPALEGGAMCYMMSKQAYLSDRDGRWQPHLMFFVPLTERKAWGAGVPGSPIFGAENPLDRLTVFLVPVSKWSDGTANSGKD